MVPQGEAPVGRAARSRAAAAPDQGGRPHRGGWVNQRLVVEVESSVWVGLGQRLVVEVDSVSVFAVGWSPARDPWEVPGRRGQYADLIEVGQRLTACTRPQPFLRPLWLGLACTEVTPYCLDHCSGRGRYECPGLLGSNSHRPTVALAVTGGHACLGLTASDRCTGRAVAGGHAGAEGEEGEEGQGRQLHQPRGQREGRPTDRQQVQADGRWWSDCQPLPLSATLHSRSQGHRQLMGVSNQRGSGGGGSEAIQLPLSAHLSRYRVAHMLGLGLGLAATSATLSRCLVAAHSCASLL